MMGVQAEHYEDVKACGKYTDLVAGVGSRILHLAAYLLRRGMASPDEKPPARAHQLDVLQSMTELMDSLPTKESKQEVLAFLAASLGVAIKEPSSSRPGSGYGYRPKRRS